MSFVPPVLPWLDCLYGAEPAGAWVELRAIANGQVCRRGFLPVRDSSAIVRAVRSAGESADVYLGVSPRARREGGRAAIEHSHVLWADCDTPESIAALERFEPAPAIVVNSGRGRHAYWSLATPAAPDVIERANRRLGFALRADIACADAARILRAPGSLNRKTDPPRRVTLERCAPEIVTVGQVVGHLPDPPDRPSAPRNATPPPVAPAAGGDPLLSIPPALYVEALTGREVGRDGKITCPFHEDRTPSLHITATLKRAGTATAVDAEARSSTSARRSGTFSREAATTTSCAGASPKRCSGAGRRRECAR